MTKHATSADNQPERPNGPGSSLPLSHSYKKSERLKKQAGFDFLYEKGKRYDRNFFFAMYSFEYPAHHLTSALMAAFSAPKKNFRKAVTRNLLKRRMKEAWRVNNSQLKIKLRDSQRNLVLAVRFKGKDVLDFQTIEKEMSALIRFLESKV